MSTRMTQVDFGETHLVRVEEFDEDWPLSITVTYEEDRPRPARTSASLDPGFSDPNAGGAPGGGGEAFPVNLIHLYPFQLDRHWNVRPAGRWIILGEGAESN